MKTKRGVMFATLLAIGGVAGGVPAASAAQGPCRGDDAWIDATGRESIDDNGNGKICHHFEIGGRKKTGNASRYYDDRI